MQTSNSESDSINRQMPQYEELVTGVNCPTCNGTGKVPRDKFVADELTRTLSVDPMDPTVHTNTIEGTWAHMKAQFHHMHGTSDALFESHIKEYSVALSIPR